MKYRIFNFLAFEAAWLACVLGAAKGSPLLGPLVVSFVLWLHLGISARPREEVRLILFAVGMGLIFDSLLLASGWLEYPNGIIMPGFAPYWILAMWALFATTLNSSMAWIKIDLRLAAVMGGIFGPLSYLAGQRIGGLEFTNQTAAMISLAVVWALAMPLLVLAARKFNGFAPRDADMSLAAYSRG